MSGARALRLLRILRDLKGAREIFATILVGLATFLLVQFVKGSTFIGDEELGAQDQALAMRADTKASAVVPPFLMLDINQRDQRTLGFPPVAPRRFLARLLQVVAAGHPRLVVVDLDLTWRDDPAGERELSRVLGNIAAENRTPILLVRQPFGRDEGLAPDVLKETPYDTVVDKSNNLFWVSAIAPTDGDGITRRYRIATPVCRAGRSVRLLGVQLAGCMALGGPPFWPSLRNTFDVEPRCDSAGAPDLARLSRVPPQLLQCGKNREQKWAISDPVATGQIAYSMRWMLPVGWRRPQVSLPHQSAAVEEVETLDAVELLKHTASVESAVQFGQRIVIIGSSAEQLGDIYRTSIGSMPGIMVIANAVRSAVENGPTAASQDLALSLFIVTLMSAASALVWSFIKRIRGLGHILFKDAAAPLLSLAWLFLLGSFLPATHVLDFLYPQIFTTLFLVVTFSLEEARKMRLV